MNRFYTIEFEVDCCADNCLQGDFNEETVIAEVKDFLEARYGSRLKWFVIKDEDEECIYDSLNVITKINEV